MTTNTIAKFQAVAATRLTYVPANLDPRALVDTLGRLGLIVPTKLSAAAATGESLRASGHRFTIREVDAALVAANVTISDRFRVKTAMGRNGILER